MKFQRWLTAGGLVALLPAWLFSMLLMLIDASDPEDGATGGYYTAGMWSLGASALVGVVALCLPSEPMGRKEWMRVAFSGAQWVLLLGAPLLVAAD